MLKPIEILESSGANVFLPHEITAGDALLNSESTFPINPQDERGNSMALIDYGAVAFKNGVCLNSGEPFPDMKTAVGWSDEKYAGASAYIGDADLTISVYKTYLTVYLTVYLQKMMAMPAFQIRFSRPIDDMIDHLNGRKLEPLKKVYHNSICGTDVTIKRIGNATYHLSMVYKGDYYHLIFGYGIDAEKCVWNRSKVDYLGKKVARKIDRIYDKICGGNW